MGGFIGECYYNDNPTQLMCFGAPPEAIREALERRDGVPYSLEHRTELTVSACKEYAKRLSEGLRIQPSYNRVLSENYQQCLENIKKRK